MDPVLISETPAWVWVIIGFGLGLIFGILVPIIKKSWKDDQDPEQ